MRGQRERERKKKIGTIFSTSIGMRGPPTRIHAGICNRPQDLFFFSKTTTTNYMYTHTKSLSPLVSLFLSITQNTLPHKPHSFPFCQKPRKK